GGAGGAGKGADPGGAGALRYSSSGICPNSRFANCTFNPSPPPYTSPVFAAGSKHAGGICNVAMGDGSVRGINAPNIDSLSLAYLAGTRDGEIQGADF